jgi:RHS repeat-associated protein
MSCDRMGRRVTKNDQCFVYGGYLQIADNAGNAYIWDCTENVTTRPLAWTHGNFVTYYTHDGNKNVSEVIATDCTLVAHYDYSPFGVVSAQCGTSAAANPLRFACEYADDDMAMVYYNYRHYEPIAGRWLSRDDVDEIGL